MSLSLKNISKSFGEKTLFRDFSYIFQNCGIYAICGDSGAGKTTLLRIIASLDKDFEGSVILSENDKISVCFQEHRLFSHLTALENVSKVSFKTETSENVKKAKDMLKRLGFSEADMNLYPSELSGGMKQRVAFARAVLREASILILDEATKELDETIRDLALAIIKEESEHRLVIIVTHKKEELKMLEAKIVTIE